MALRWLLHSVCTSAFGYPKNDVTAYLKNEYRMPTTMGYPNEGLTNGSSKGQVETSAGETGKGMCGSMFQMPLHYPRYKRVDYEKMDEWKVDMLLKQYGLSCEGSLDEKRSFAMGAFLWPDQM